jgi:hypothetical protein
MLLQNYEGWGPEIMCWDRADRREIAGLRSGIWKLMGLRGGVERGIGPLCRVKGNEFV